MIIQGKLHSKSTIALIVFFFCIIVFAQDKNTGNKEKTHTKLQEKIQTTNTNPQRKIESPNNKQQEKIKTINNKSSSISIKDDKTISSNEQKDIVLDFPDIELVNFAKFVAQLSNKVLIGGDQLKGNITVKTGTKLNLKEVMNVFREIILEQGFDYIAKDIYIVIMPYDDSKIETYKLNYLKCDEVQNSLSQVFRVARDKAGRQIPIRISAINSANSIAVIAPMEKQLEIQNIIKKIDFRKRQVLIEIMFIEMTLNDGLSFGVNFVDSWSNGLGAVGVGQAAGAATSANLPSFSSTGAAQPYVSIVQNQGLVDFAVAAGQKNDTLKLLAQPKLLTSENREATFDVLTKQPIESTSTKFNASTTPTTNSKIEYIDIGIQTKITPRINKKRDVTLDMSLKVSSIIKEEEFSGTNKVPVLGTRELKLCSTVADNQQLVIGGLLKNAKKIKRTSVPGFGDLPFIGWLFAKTEEVSEQVELIILIRPRVIEHAQDSIRVTDKAIQDIENYDLMLRKEITEMVKGKKTDSFDIFNIFNFFELPSYRISQEFVPPLKTFTNFQERL
jgi:type II secretory pathway component GspD/PulD (secretin)